ncbi:DMT family transporter [Pseudoduganella aquatica]|uniref:Guanidinium exporter n=1 Tax=Pseudoduganella aquatica TaxID=2660641 RepID=A0A7X4KLC7_9BURK|nr:multidrug efflux SMR transporter [Pseudoduganella aquatica]MYN08064.1 QacE family quaternary ammonium compound efflux SMR transporter [Pseudoduganella aquatica]
MAWIYLAIAGLLEIAFALGMKWSQGFTRPLPGVATAVLGIASIWLLSVSLRALPVGTAYAVWTGIGAVGTALVGIVFLGDAASPARVACLAAIIGGLIGLKLLAGDG